MMPNGGSGQLFMRLLRSLSRIPMVTAGATCLGLSVEPALSIGDYQPLRSRNDILLYKRARAGDEILVALNTVHQPRKLDWEGEGKLLLSTYLDGDVKPVAGPCLLRPDEGIIVKLGI